MALHPMALPTIAQALRWLSHDGASGKPAVLWLRLAPAHFVALLTREQRNAPSHFTMAAASKKLAIFG
jgi:hypothetical protein